MTPLIEAMVLLQQVRRIYWWSEFWAWTNGLAGLVNVGIAIVGSAYWPLTYAAIIFAGLVTGFFIRQMWVYARAYHHLEHIIEEYLLQ